MTGPGDGLYLPAATPVHRLPAHAKILGLLAYVVVVVSTPAGSWSAYGGQALVLLAVVGLARLPLSWVARRMVVETPFVVFAMLLPVVGSGPRVDVAGLSLSEAGLIGGGTLLAKATLGVVAAIVLAATTTARDLVAALDRLRLPSAVVGIVSFMVRYVAVVGSQLRRMRIARESRGAAASRARHLAAVAGSAGRLFVRSYERGERVHQAMLARGYRGSMPALEGRPARAGAWVASAVPATAALVIAGLLGGKS